MHGNRTFAGWAAVLTGSLFLLLSPLNTTAQESGHVGLPPATENWFPANPTLPAMDSRPTELGSEATTRHPKRGVGSSSSSSTGLYHNDTVWVVIVVVLVVALVVGVTGGVLDAQNRRSTQSAHDR